MPSPSIWLRRRRHALDRRVASAATTGPVVAIIVLILAVSSATILVRTPVATGGGEVDAPPTAAAEALPPAPDPVVATSPDASPRPATAPADPADPVAPPSAADDDTVPAHAPGTPPAEPPGSRRSAGDGAPDDAAAAAHGGEERRAATAAAAQQQRPRDPARTRFESAFPAHAGARQDASAPETTRWAVLIGVNEHVGRTRDNVASRQDAEDLARHLRSIGWRDDHVLVLTDASATRENIVQALGWLARKTTPGSLAVVHYSGHTKQWHGRDADGDGEVTDEALWPSDNRFILDSELVRLLRRIPADRLWFNVAACEAAGFNDPGLEGPGRLLTFSSREDEKSYEDPSRGNSVWGYHLIEEGLIAGYGDLDRDGVVTVQEAFTFAAPRAVERTREQGHGPQRPVMVDGLDGALDLRIPAPPPHEPRPEPSDDDRDCTLVLCPRAAGSRSVTARPAP